MTKEATSTFDAPRPPRLTRRFVTLGAVVLLAGALLMAEIDRRTTESELNRQAEANNAALTTLIANSIWPRYADFADRGQTLSREALQNAPETQRLLAEIRSLVAGLDVLKVKLYDVRGTTIFSSQTSQIGTDYSSNERFISSMAGDIASELEWREEFASIAGPVAERWVLSSYIPVRRSKTGSTVLGVAEIYRDVTVVRAEARQTLIVRAAIIGTALTVLFIVLTFIVWKSDLRLAQYHRREFSLRTAAAEAEAKSEAKSRFLANMSHEIRTPMNGVLGMAGLLAKTSLDARQQRFLLTIRQSGEALLSIVNSILDFSKIEAGDVTLERSRFKIVDCVNEVADLLLPFASEKGISFRSRIDIAEDQQALGDRHRLKQVLTNLIANAIKFTESGEVALTASVAERSGDRLRIRFEVRDSGVGISGDQREQIFKPFFQVDEAASRKFGGTGLGLSVSRELVEMMGGAISFESEAGSGSTFWFEIPFDEPNVDSQGTEATGIDDRRGKRGETAQILLVEDNDVNLVVAEETLIAFGYTVDAVKNGQDAISAWESSRYQLILMDIQMPGIDGREATRAIRRREQERGLMPIPIVALTAHAFENDREMCLDVGMNDYVTKPFAEEDLRAVLSRFAAPSMAATVDSTLEEFADNSAGE